MRTNQSFFLSPGEQLEKGVQSVYVLSEEESLLLTAVEKYDDKGVTRKPGERWMIYGEAHTACV